MWAELSASVNPFKWKTCGIVIMISSRLSKLISCRLNPGRDGKLRLFLRKNEEMAAVHTVRLLCNTAAKS